MSAKRLAKRVGLTARQIQYLRDEGYVKSARKQGSAWVYDLESERRLVVVARLRKERASPRAAFAAVGNLASNAVRWLGTDFWKLRLHVVGREVFATNGKLLVNARTGQLSNPILLGTLRDQVRPEARPVSERASKKGALP